MAEAEQVEVAGIPAGRHGRSRLLIGLVVALLMASGVGGYALLKLRSHTADAPGPSNPSWSRKNSICRWIPPSW